MLFDFYFNLHSWVSCCVLSVCNVILSSAKKKKNKVTYVVLESQYQSSLTKACQRINESRDDVCVECVGYLLEELRDPKNVAAFKKDVESSNIFIGSLIFVQVKNTIGAAIGAARQFDRRDYMGL